MSIAKKNPQVCLLGASFGTSNMGVNALTAGAVTAFVRRHPDGELFLLDYGTREAAWTVPAGNRAAAVRLVNIRFSKKVYLRNNIALLIALALLARAVPFRRVRKKIISGNPWLRRVAEADSVVSLAGGDSFSDIYGLGRLLYVALPQLLALALGKRLVLLPQTIGPFRGGVAKGIAAFILRRAAVVYSRDRAGLEETSALLGPGQPAEKVKFCYDVGFVVEPSPPPRLDLDGLPERSGMTTPLVGCNISGLLYMGGYTKKNMFGLRVDYPRLVHEIIGHLIERRGASVLLVPHVFGGEGNAESDAAVCERLYAELKRTYPDRLYCARGTYDQSEIKYIIGRCDFFVGSRMHACIAALSQQVPAVAVSYSRKFIGVLETIGMESCVVDPRTMDAQEILARIDRAFEEREALAARLERTMPAAKERVLNLFGEIDEELHHTAV